MIDDAKPYWLREITEYQRLFAEPTDAERLTKLFWSISDFPSDLLFEKLQEVSGADFDDDYSEFLRKNNLLKAGLAILGIQSYTQIETILEENSNVSDRLSKVAALFPSQDKGYISVIQQKFEKTYPGSLFKYMLATVAILLVRSKSFLASWSKDFARIVGTHPTPDLSIKSVLSLVFRGESLIVDNYSMTHRNFNACSKLFIELVDDENDKAKDLIWAKKHTRILDAIGDK